MEQDAENKILKVLSVHHDGLDDKLLSANLRDVDDQTRLNVLNKLLQSNRILLNVNEKGQPVYKYQSEEQAIKMRDMDQEDVPIYQLIEESKDRGIQSMDMKNKLQNQGYNTAMINKTLKKLEKKGLIKKLKSIQQKNKQVWMLQEIEPSQEVTGGLIGEENFKKEVIEVIHEKILGYLEKSGNSSYKELNSFIKQMGMLQTGQELRDDHIRQIIQVLVFDGKIEQIQGGEKDLNAIYRISNLRYPYALQYTGVPCAHCPVRNECAPNNLINPKSCPYITDWLNNQF